MRSRVVHSFGQSLTIAVLLAVPAAMAGQERGGANAKICFKDPQIAHHLKTVKGPLREEHIPQIKSVTMLERVYTEKDYGPDSIVPMTQYEDDVSYARRIVNRWEFLVPRIHEILKLGKDVLETNFKDWDNGLVPTDDLALYEDLGDDCAPVTIAVQYQDGADTIVRRDKRVFNLSTLIFPMLDRGIVRVHEYAYLTARSLEHPDAKNTRGLVSIAIRRDSRMTLREAVRQGSTRGFGPMASEGASVAQGIAYKIPNLIHQENTRWLNELLDRLKAMGPEVVDPKVEPYHQLKYIMLGYRGWSWTLLPKQVAEPVRSLLAQYGLDGVFGLAGEAGKEKLQEAENHYGKVIQARFAQLWSVEFGKILPGLSLLLPRYPREVVAAWVEDAKAQAPKQQIPVPSDDFKVPER
jgi:hypothetical protein